MRKLYILALAVATSFSLIACTPLGTPQAQPSAIEGGGKVPEDAVPMGQCDVIVAQMIPCDGGTSVIVVHFEGSDSRPTFPTFPNKDFRGTMIATEQQPDGSWVVTWGTGGPAGDAKVIGVTQGLYNDSAQRVVQSGFVMKRGARSLRVWINTPYIGAYTGKLPTRSPAS